MNETNKRLHQRNLVKKVVDVNNGQPYQGGVLRDLSVGGAAIVYPTGEKHRGAPLEVGQKLIMRFKGGNGMPSEVVRVFDDGFATKFDFTLSVLSPLSEPD